MFWRTVVRNSDKNTTVSNEGPWERVVHMATETFRKLSTGSSWSGHERNHLFMGGLGGHQFMRVSGVSGLDDPGDSRCFATMDFDRDGWLDVLLGNVSAPRLRLLRNEFGDRKSACRNGFVAIKLVGGNVTPTASEQWSSRDGLGARVQLDLGEGQSVYREHRFDDGYKAQNSATMLIGTGDTKVIAAIHVRWPSGIEQSFASIPSGTMITVYEDASQSPNGTACVSLPYRRSPINSSKASVAQKPDWPTRMFPAEPTGHTLVLPRANGGDPDSTLVMYVGMASWCTACAKEVTGLTELAKSFKASELVMVGVPCDLNDTAQDLAAWTKRYSPPYEIRTDLTVEQRDQMLAVAKDMLLRTDALPFTVITDEVGNVLLVTWGPPSVSAVLRLVWLQRSSKAG